MQTEGNLFVASQKDLAHGRTAWVQCPEVDGVNAILIHGLAWILTCPQQTDGNAVKLSVPACCTWHFPKEAEELWSLGLTRLFSASDLAEKRMYVIRWRLCSPVPPAHFMLRWYSVKDGHTSALLPARSPPCKGMQGSANPLICGCTVIGKFQNMKLLKPVSSPEPKPYISLMSVNAS